MNANATPHILVPLLRVEASSSNAPIDIFRLNAPFVDMLNTAGAIPIGVPIGVPHESLEAYFDIVDGVLLQGGHDIHPQFFAPEESLHERVHSISVERDAFEIEVIKEADKRAVPILGVCRGAQILNVARGGTLFQDQPTQLPTDVAHFPNKEIDITKVSKDDIERVAHTVHIEAGTVLHSIFGETEVATNSLHHQAVKDLGQGLRINARAEDGVIEGVEAADMKKQWVMGIQWHPEIGTQLPHNHGTIFEHFIAASHAFKNS